MFDNLRQRFNRAHLTNPEFAFLFEHEPDSEWICLDCDYTTLEPDKAELIALAAVRVCGQRVLHSERLELVIPPRSPEGADSIRWHQIRHAVRGQTLPLDEALLHLLRFTGARPLVGYYLDFDLDRINHDVRRLLGIHLPNRSIEVSALYHETTKPTLIPHQHQPDLRYDTIRSKLNVPRIGGSPVMANALTTALIFLRLQSLQASED